MTTLTWLFFVLSFVTGAYTSYKVTKWYYKRKVEKLKNIIKLQNTSMP